MAQPTFMSILALVLALFSVTVLAQATCSCDPYHGFHIWDTQRCCKANDLGDSSDAAINGKNSLSMKCGATAAWKDRWQYLTLHQKWWYLSQPQFRSIKDDYQALAQVPAPDKVDCYMDCLRNDGPGKTDWGENEDLKAKFGDSYWMEHNRHLSEDGKIAYCYKDPTPEQFAAQKAWRKAHKVKGDPHANYRAHEQTPTLPSTGFVEAGPSRFHCVEAAWSDFV